MKVCPECNESFADDFKFCDLDGARLNRDGVSSIRDPNKLWSMLGVGLLLGALVISAITIFSLPRAEISPATSSTPPAPISNPNASASAEPSSTEQAVDSNTDSQMLAEDTTLVEPKKEKVVPNTIDENANTASKSPKAAAMEEEEKEKALDPSNDPALVPPVPKKPQPSTDVKTVSDTRDSDAKSGDPTADAKKDDRRESARMKADAKDAASKKKDDDKKDKKKKGGFLRVFKKIFGKDDN